MSPSRPPSYFHRLRVRSAAGRAPPILNDKRNRRPVRCRRSASRHDRTCSPCCRRAVRSQREDCAESAGTAPCDRRSWTPAITARDLHAGSLVQPRSAWRRRAATSTTTQPMRRSRSPGRPDGANDELGFVRRVRRSHRDRAGNPSRSSRTQSGTVSRPAPRARAGAPTGRAKRPSGPSDAAGMNAIDSVG